MAGKAGGSVSGVSGNQGNKNSGGGNPADRTKSKNKGVDRSKKGIQKAGGPTATAANAPEGSLRVMRQSTWDRMSAGVKMREYNTTSYAKYKASKTRGKTSARDMKSL